ncbi:MAG: hypothetical protein ACXU99_04615 [Thermodesulfobacteriota bacterium]
MPVHNTDIAEIFNWFADLLEIDGTNPFRVRAYRMGIKVAICTDAHRTSELDYIRLGIGQARPGWLEREDVLNTRNWKEIKQRLKRK